MNSISGTVNWGIIGCGDVCEVKSGPAFNRVDNSKLVAVMRRDEALAADFARRHHVPRYYSDASKLINDPEVNAIYVATPPSTHAQFMEEALRAGKPVYVEKPVTLNAELCRGMIDVKNKLGGTVSVAHYRRELQAFKKVKELINSGAIGKVNLMRLVTLQPNKKDVWRVDPRISGGGLFHDLSPHQLDIASWLFGEPVDVRGYSMDHSLTTVQAVFGKNILLQGVWNFNTTFTKDVCEIIGTQGIIKFSFFKMGAIELNDAAIAQEYPENIQKPMIEAVVKFFKGERENPCSLEEALTTMNIIDSTL